MQFASRVGSGSSMLSPLAQPYRMDGSVAAYLHDQACKSPATETPSATYSQQNMQHLESLLGEMATVSINDNTTIVKRNDALEPLSGLELSTAISAHIGPVAPPSPAPSARLAPRDEPVVRVTMHVWDSMGRDMEALKEEKRVLETKIARLGKQKVVTPGDDYKDELETQIGKLRYQNECNKTQKSSMGRALSEKDMEIKHLKLELDHVCERLETTTGLNRDYADVAAQRDYLQAALKNDRIGNAQLISDMTGVKDRQIQTLSQTIEDLQGALKQGADDNEYKALAQERLDQLSQYTKQIQSVNDKYTSEKIKSGELEDRIEALQNKLDQVGDLEAQLSEKTSVCDRLRTKLKTQEKILDDTKRRLNRASSGDAMRGAAHLVKPEPSTKLSPKVMGCSECYAKNIDCDNRARCRHCTENNETCARWRCSLRHALGKCPNMPCTFPHEVDGWLLAPEPRPQW